MLVFAWRCEMFLWLCNGALTSPRKHPKGLGNLFKTRNLGFLPCSRKDHFETSAEALADVAPLLRRAARQ